MRDLPEGKDRREALLTWVGDHWRQNRHDPDIEIYVRKHLLIAERAAMKAAGEDKRLRRS